MTPAPVPLADLAAQLAPLKPALHAALERCLGHAGFILGAEVAAFEQALGRFLEVEAAVGVSSGTDALIAALLALDPEPGSEVLTTPFTFIATATSAVHAGLRPVFADLAPGAFCPGLAEYERSFTPRTRAVIAVHLFGEPLDLRDLAELCRQRGAVLIEDCAQAIGARTPGQRHVGLAGQAGTLSFFPAKNLGALGDGGAVFGDDPEFAERIRRIRQHGQAARYRHERLGGNWRLDALQAAFLGELLPHLPAWTEARRANAARYLEALAPLARQRPEELRLPVATPGHCWNQFVLCARQRDALQACLKEAGVATAIYYPLGLHRQPALAPFAVGAQLRETDARCQEALALPVHPLLGREQQERVVEAIRSFYRSN
jgi:dTDP-4-amino-4,6-dideoxygalactose transaminase